MPHARAPKISFAVSDEQLTGKAGLALVGQLGDLARFAQPPRSGRGNSSAGAAAAPNRDMLLALIYSFCCGGGHLTDVDALAQDAVAGQVTVCPRCPTAAASASTWRACRRRALAGLRHCVPPSQRLPGAAAGARLPAASGVCASLSRRHRD